MQVYRTYVVPATGHVEEDDRRAAALLPDELRRVLLLEGERSPKLDEFVVRWQQTTGACDGEGRRGHSLLPVVPARRAERGRRRPRPLRARPGRLPPRRARASAASPTLAARLADPRHETGGRRPRPDRRARRDAAANGPSVCGAGATSPAAWTTRTRSTSSGRRSSAPGRSSRRASSCTSRRRCGKASGRRAGPSRTSDTNGAPSSSCATSTRTKPSSTTSSRSSQRVKLAGEHASLGALLLQLTAPGVPDIYQGDELWSLNLVDPDNRRPVDWRRLASRSGHRDPRTMKLHLIRRVLRLRAERPEAFSGSYEPLELGPDRVGFVRGGSRPRRRAAPPARPRQRQGRPAAGVQAGAVDRRLSPSGSSSRRRILQRVCGWNNR